LAKRAKEKAPIEGGDLPSRVVDARHDIKSIGVKRGGHRRKRKNMQRSLLPMKARGKGEKKKMIIEGTYRKDSN